MPQTTLPYPEEVVRFDFDQDAEDFKDAHFVRKPLDEYKMTAFVLLPTAASSPKFDIAHLKQAMHALNVDYGYKIKTNYDNSTAVVVQIRGGITIPQLNLVDVQANWFISRLIFPKM